MAPAVSADRAAVFALCVELHSCGKQGLIRAVADFGRDQPWFHWSFTGLSTWEVCTWSCTWITSLLVVKVLLVLVPSSRSASARYCICLPWDARFSPGSNVVV